MAANNGRERVLGILTTPRQELLQKLSIAKTADRAKLEERSDLLDNCLGTGRHESVLSCRSSVMYWDKDARRIPNFGKIANSVHAGDWMPRSSRRADDGRRTDYRKSLKSLVLNRQINLKSAIR